MRSDPTATPPARGSMILNLGQRRQLITRPWGMVDNQLWLSIFCVLQKQSVQLDPLTRTKLGQAFRNYNSPHGCQLHPCPYAHACFTCNIQAIQIIHVGNGLKVRHKAGVPSPKSWLLKTNLSLRHHFVPRIDVRNQANSPIYASRL